MLAKVLSIAFFKESVFKKYLLIYVSPSANHFANQSDQLCVKCTLAIEGVWKNTKHVPASMMLNFRLATIYLSIYK